MPVNVYPEYEVILMSHDKCASSTLDHVFGFNYIKGQWSGMFGIPLQPDNKPNKLSYYKTMFPGYKTITFVRNPWDRVVSLYCHEMRDLTARGRLDLVVSFGEFIHALTTPDHPYRRLKHFSENIDINPDFVGRFETLYIDIETLGKLYNTPIVSVPCLVASKERATKHYRDFYTDSSTCVEKVRSLFNDDIERFMYEY